MTLEEFTALIAGLVGFAVRHRFKVAQAAYRYQDLRDRGASRSQARIAVEARRDLLGALLLTGLLQDFRTLD